MRNKNGWGLSTMLMLLGVMLFFALIAGYYIYKMYTGGLFS